MKTILMIFVIVVIGACSNIEQENSNQIELNGIILGSTGDTTNVNATIGGFEGEISTLSNKSGKISRIIFISYNEKVNNVRFKQLLLAIESKYGIKLVLIDKNINMYSAVVDGIQFELNYQFGNLLFTIDNTIADI